MLASTFIRDLETFRRRRLVHLRRFHNELLLGGAAGNHLKNQTLRQQQQRRRTTHLHYYDYRYLTILNRY